MGILSVLNAVTGTPPPGPPIVERLRAQLAEQEALLPSRREAVTEANFQAAVLPSPENDAALSLAQAALDQTIGRCDRLRQALQTAIEKAQEAHADTDRREHEARLKKLAAHTVTLKRAIKKQAAYIEQCVRNYDEVLATTEAVIAAFPGQTPRGHFLHRGEFQHGINVEIGRLIARAHPEKWAEVGARHYMGIRAGDAGMFHPQGTGHLPSLEEKAAQAMASLMNLAGAAPVKHVDWSAPRLPSIVFEPGQLEALKAQNAEQMAELTAPTPPAWPAHDLEAQKAEFFNTLGDAEPPLEGDELEALASEWNKENSPPEEIEEFLATQPRPGGDTDATE